MIMALIRLAGHMRRDRMIEFLRKNDTVYGYLDQPEGVRWILSLEEYHLGSIYVYKADRCNKAEGSSSVLVGHQDSVVDIIHRGNARLTKFKESKDLTPIVCP